MQKNNFSIRPLNFLAPKTISERPRATLKIWREATDAPTPELQANEHTHRHTHRIIVLDERKEYRI